MKKIICLFLASVMVFALSSCSSEKSESVLTVNDSADIDTQIFTYFLNIAYRGNGLSDSECIESATSECLKYIAVNTKFAEMGSSLTLSERAALSRETNALWRLQGDYFTEIGVSKDAFFKIKQYEYYKDSLRLALYDKDGEKPINEDYIKQYFTTNYVGIKYFYEELYTPVSQTELDSMTELEKAVYEAEKNAASSRYEFISEIANYVNSGVYTIDEAFMAVTSEVSADISVSATVVGRNDASFSSEFINAVFKQSVGSAFIITNSEKSNIYFIERVDLLSDEYGFYGEYREQCLAAVSESYFVGDINSWVSSCSAVRHLRAANACLKKIKNADRTKYICADGREVKGFAPNAR